jgi:TNF receptor-associated protein 1
LSIWQGVADCEDIPLNISRETMQDSALMAKLKRVLTGRVIKFLTEMSKKGDQKKYETFFGEFGMQIKEGICVEESQDTKQKMAPLLRFESSTCDAGAAVSLDDYVERCKEEQKSIYYLCAPSRELALNSTYMEAFKRSGTEVLFMYGQADDFVMRHLRQYRGASVRSHITPSAMSTQHV